METIIVLRSIVNQLFFFMSDLFHNRCLCSVDHGDATIEVADSVLLLSDKLAKNEILQQRVDVQIITELSNEVFSQRGANSIKLVFLTQQVHFL